MRNALLLTILLPASLHAQQIKPRIIFDVDTSGSMAWEACDTGGTDVDHTTDCPGTDVPCALCNTPGCDDLIPNDGRLWKVKTAIADVVTAFGEVQFALARFHSDPTVFACKGGGWNGPSALCLGAPLGEGDNASDILVEFGDDNQQDLLEWIDFETNTAFPPSPTGCNLCADCGGGCDKELRPTGATPNAGSIVSCRDYLSTVRSTDPQFDCRPYGMILLTDGQNTCPDPDDTSDPDPSPEQAAMVCAQGIPVHVIGFASGTIQAVLDEIAAAGCGPACADPDMDGIPNCSPTAIPVANETDLALAFANIIQASFRLERCNGADDDCDGEIDEDFVTLGAPCGTGRCSGSVCCDTNDPNETSTTCCGGNPQCEDCNRIDDDCDGLTDIGVLDTCDGIIGDDLGGVCQCYPEECNGVDDDCDCTLDSNGDGTFCGSGDANVDEEPLTTSGYPCGTDTGVCVSGLTCCADAELICCFATEGTQEVCDCLDNDCNGATDEGGGLPCFTLGDGCDPLTRDCKGICVLGHHQCTDLDPGPGCISGAGPCLGERGPDPETCNCVDDNCNDLTDEDVICSGGGRCENCACPTDCNPNIEFPCPIGFNCECAADADCDCTAGSKANPDCDDNYFCQVDICLGVICAACQYCDAAAGGICLPQCGNQILCEGWQECRCETCVDISCTNPLEKTCGQGETCNPNTHACDRDPCLDTTCAEGEYCRSDGQCGADLTDLCVPVCPTTCAEDEKCECGRCVENACAGIACNPGLTCCDGKCIADPCEALTCESGTEWCDSCSGSCLPNPCLLGQITCPEDFICQAEGECRARSAVERERVTVSASGVGGCECGVGSARPAPSPLIWAMALGLFLALVWRRSCRS